MTTAVPNTKIGEVENKIPDTSGLVTTAVLNTKIGEVENRICDLSDLVKKTDYDAKIKDTEGKYFTTADYSKFTSDILDARIKQKELVGKSELNTKLTTLATKGELKVQQDIVVKMKTYDLSYFLGKSFFGDDGFQNTFVYQPTLELKKKTRALIMLSVGNQKIYLNLNVFDFVVLSYLI